MLGLSRIINMRAENRKSRDAIGLTVSIGWEWEAQSVDSQFEINGIIIHSSIRKRDDGVKGFVYSWEMDGVNYQIEETDLGDLKSTLYGFPQFAAKKE